MSVAYEPMVARDLSGPPADVPTAWPRRILDAPVEAAELASDVPLPLAQMIDIEASYFRGEGTAFGDLIARTLSELAASVKFVSQGRPISVRDFEERLAIQERWLRDDER